MLSLRQGIGRPMKSSVQAHRLGRGNETTQPRAGTTRCFVRVHENLQSQVLQVIALGTTQIPGFHTKLNEEGTKVNDKRDMELRGGGTIVG